MRLSLLLFLSTLRAQPLPCGSELCRLIDRSGDLQPEIRRFYRDLQYQPAWTHEGIPTARAQALVGILEHAADRGLQPGHYQVLPSATASHARFDVALTAALLRFLSDLHFGRADPGIYRPIRISRAERSELPLMLRRLLEADDPQVAIAVVEPPFVAYRRSLAMLHRYQALAAAGDSARLPVTAAPLKPFSEYAGIEQLTRLLRLLGDLPPDVLAPTNYSGPLVEAVRHFQERHGLEPDGLIGKATLEQLNTPLPRRVRQLELTLERWRWVPHSFPHPPVVINLAEFTLRAYGVSYVPELELKVVTGAAYRHSTPAFTGEMRFVEFRPYWNVPLSIQRDEIVPMLAKDPLYLQNNGFEVVSPAGKVMAVDPKSPEVLSHLRDGALRVRQLPGPDNALGLVKFIFPNRYGVYLHDTPARGLFQRARRDFSHGCVRVEKASDLAEWVLRSEPDWSRERIAEAMNGAETVRVELKQRVPVLIVYATAVALANGDVRFLADTYRYDEALERALTRIDKARTALSASVGQPQGPRQ